MLLPSDWNVPEAIHVRLGDKVGRQRAMFAEGHLLLLLHKPPKAGQRKRQGAFFWRDPEGNWRSTLGSGDGLTALHRHMPVFATQINQLDQALEQASSASDYYGVLQGVGPLHRAVANLRLTLQSARDLVPDSKNLIVARDEAVELDIAAELLHQDARHGLDFAMAQQAEEQAAIANRLSRSAHRLNLLAAIFLPMTAIGAIFGMNMHSGFENTTPAVFWLLVFVGLILGISLQVSMVGQYAREMLARRQQNTRKPEKKLDNKSFRET